MKNSRQKSSQRIETPPTAPTVEQDDTSCWMDWRLKLPRGLGPEEVPMLTASLEKPGFQARIITTELDQIVLRVRQLPQGDYTDLYDASLGALFQIERIVGSLVLIEGLPRDRWNKQFMFARRFGALE